MMKKLLFACLIIALTFSSNAQWTRITPVYPGELQLVDIYADSFKINAVGTDLTNFQGVTFHSNDSGTSWDTTRPMPPGYFFKALSFKDNDTGLIAGYGSVSIFMRSNNGGQSWYYYLVDTSTKGLTDIVFINDKFGLVSGYGSTQFSTGNCIRTYDGGNSWAYSNSLGLHPLDTIGLDHIDFLDEQTGYAINNLFGKKYLLKTEDTGNSWSLIYTHSCSIGGIYFWNVNDGIMVDMLGKIYKTSDGGVYWTEKSSPVTVELNSISFLDNKLGYAVGDSGTILQTTDGGETWTKETSPTSSLLTKVRFFGSHAYATGEAGTILRSSSILGINNAALKEYNLNVYPNPASTELYVSTVNKYNNISVSLTDVDGKVVKNATTKTALLKIDIRDLSSGTYLVQINVAGNLFTQKIVVSH